MPDAQFVEGQQQNLAGRIFVECGGRLKFNDRLIVAALLGQSEREIVVRGVISVGDGQRITPKRFRVAPAADLAIGKATQNEDDEQGGGSAPCGGDAILGGGRVECPHDGHIQTDERDVGVAVGHGLLADGYDPDHGDQSSEKPEPAYRQISAVAPPQYRRRHKKQQRRRSQHLPDGQRTLGTRIHGSEPGWPKRFPQVADVRNQGILQACRHRDLRHCADGKSIALGNHGHDGIGRGKNEEGNFSQTRKRNERGVETAGGSPGADPAFI